MTTDVPSIVLAAGGEVVGKVRLQKEFYLLDQMGLRSGYPFEYHHYGPYSDLLAEQVEDDVVFRRLELIPHRRTSDGVPFATYRAKAPGAGDRIDQNMSIRKIKAALSEMQRQSSAVLELAATIHWLAAVEECTDWKEELIRRKGAKTQGDRDKQALALLKTLGISPAAD